MHPFNTILFCSALVSATPRIFGRTNAINQLAPRSTLLLSSLPRMSGADAHALVTNEDCYNGNRIPWPQNDLPPPIKDTVSEQLTVYDAPVTTPNMLTIHNYCDYDIHYLHLNEGDTLGQSVLQAHATFTHPLSTGTVWKGSKTADLAKVVLIEYNVAKATGMLWYNLSLVKCLVTDPKNAMYTTDTSQCAGHEAGLQFGNREIMSYQCKDGTWCDDQAYLYDENLCKKLNPVSQCKPELGVTMEFCASKKH